MVVLKGGGQRPERLGQGRGGEYRQGVFRVAGTLAGGRAGQEEQHGGEDGGGNHGRANDHNRRIIATGAIYRR